MCTVVFRVPGAPTDPVLVLAVRDEDPARAWNPLGEWWPDRAGVIGVQDRRAGGAWLAAHPRRGRLAVTLNREGEPAVSPDAILSRGALALDAVDGQAPDAHDRMRGFNLLAVHGGSVEITSWDGSRFARDEVGPGTHMLAHHDVDDPRSARIAAWLDAFRAAPATIAGWTDVLARTGELDPADDRAIARDNRPHGYPTMSTLACVASVRPGRAEVRYAEFATPGAWSPLTFA
ncbi:NRDE family protein [Microbacterium karelineae]|uniref:NRDE family protein n=1 Tax=Microbacterium karelineae TaxID=2654283 RepID=UPI0012EA47B0|nr:NRDE family protein [Microbacterium karelineae]